MEVRGHFVSLGNPITQISRSAVCSMPTEVSETVRINSVLKFLYSTVSILECMTSAKSGCVRTYQMNLTNVSLVSHNPFYHDPFDINVSCTTVIQFISTYFLYS